METPQGLVLAAAGVDASNMRSGELALLPLDSDASARALRDALRAALGVEVAVVVSDTTGRPWRIGVVDVAIGAAGIRAVDDLRGATDTHGARLEMTEVAVADELAAAAELAKGKLTAVPVAVVRGLSPVDDPRGAKALLRPSTDDLFRLGTAEAIEQGRREALSDVDEPAPAVHADAVALLSSWQDRTTASSRSRWPCSRTCWPARTRPAGPAAPGTSPPARWSWMRPASTSCSPCTRGSRLGLARRPHRARGRHRAGRRVPGGVRGERHRGARRGPGADLPRRAPGDVLARHPHPAPGRDVPGRGRAGRAARAQRRVDRPAVVPGRRAPDGVVADLPPLLARGLARTGRS